MTARPNPSQFEIAPDPEARAARRIAVAHQLVEMGLALAETAQRRALACMEQQIAAAEAGDVDAALTPTRRQDDPVAAAERAARAVRLSLALAARLDSDEPVRRGRLRADAAAEREAEKAAQRRALFDMPIEPSRAEARVETVVDLTGQALDMAGLDEDEVDQRIETIEERLYEGEWEIDIFKQPIGAMVAQLCAELGVEPDWSVWEDQPWAIKEARTNAEGSPYAEGGAAWVDRDDADADAPPEEPAEEGVGEPVSTPGSSP